VWITVLGVLEQNAIHVGTRVLEELVAAAEHDESYLAVAQNAQLVRFLHQSKLALRERYLREHVMNMHELTSYIYGYVKW